MTSVGKAVLWASSGKFISFAVAFATSIIIARAYLGPEEIGLFSIAFAATALLAVLQEFGLNRYIVGEPELDDDKIRTAFSVSLAVAWGVALLILVAAQPIALFYKDARLLPLILVIGASYFLVPLAIVPTALLQRKMDFRSDFMTEVGATLANASTALFLATRGFGPMALAWGAFAQQAARAAISQWRNGGIFPWPVQFSNSATVLRFGGGSTLLQIFDSIGSRSPDLVVGRIAGNEMVGLYSRASGLAVQIVYLITGSVNSVFYPVLAQQRDQGKPLDAPYAAMVAGYTGVIFPAMAGLAVAALPLVHILYGERWLGVAPALSILAIAEMIIVALPMCVQIPILLGRLDSVVKRSAAATILAIGLLAFGAAYGTQGAALGYVGYACLLYGIYARFMQKLVGFKWRALLVVYAQSLVGAAAAILPLLAGYYFWVPAANMTFVQLLPLVLAGMMSWIGAMQIVRHPLLATLTDMAQATRQRLLPESA